MSNEKKLCKKCFYPGTFYKYDTFSYWYCKRCKIEIPDPSVKPKMIEINLLNPIPKPEYSIEYPTEQGPGTQIDWGYDPGKSGLELDDPDLDDAYDTKST